MTSEASTIAKVIRLVAPLLVDETPAAHCKCLGLCTGALGGSSDSHVKALLGGLITPIRVPVRVLLSLLTTYLLSPRPSK